MIKIDKIHDFTVKWLNKFKDKNISYKELISPHMGKECSEFGFQIYCGYTFTEKYGNINDPKIFKEVLKDIIDINLLGSAIYSKWNYFNSWAYSDAEILKNKNREWFIIALEHLAKLSEIKPYGNIKKVKIISNRVSSKHYIFNPEDEIQQSLTINPDGHVWFSAYTSEKRKDGKYKKNRMHNFRIDSSVAENIIDDIISCFIGCEYDNITPLTKEPIWTIEITTDEGKIIKFYDQFYADFEELDLVEDLSAQIHKSLKIPNLFLFDGKFEEDIIDRIVVDYHRITKINTKRAFDKEKKPFDWNYIERLIVDRETKTIEHIQNVGLGCTVSKKYTSENEIDDILNDLDIDSFLEKDVIEEKYYDLKIMPFDERKYTITVTLRNGGDKKISGTYDKKGLPSGWEDFAETVYSFISFYGCGEILSSAVYGRDYDDIILCHVKFKNGHKTYNYISDFDNIDVGDKVVVPVWDDNHETTAEVVKIKYIPEKEMIIPIEKIKHIIRKCSKM